MASKTKKAPKGRAPAPLNARQKRIKEDEVAELRRQWFKQQGSA